MRTADAPPSPFAHKPNDSTMMSTQETKRRKRQYAEAAAAATPIDAGGERVNIIAQLEDAEGVPTGPQLDLPHDADPKQLEELLNALLQNDDKVHPEPFHPEP